MRKGFIAAGFAALLMSSAASAQTLNVATAGDQNMVDYIKDYLGPLFEKSHPGVKVVAVGTGPGDGGSQKIYEKLDAQKKANAPSDFDVVVIHQKAAGTMVKEDLLKKYRDTLPTGNLVTRETATNALGADVSGYVMPMFHSQTAIAYNPDLVKNPPNSYPELREWVKKNPKQFGYNGIKGGMSGVAFVTGWISAFGGGDAAKLEKGPYDPAVKATWDKAMADLKEFNQNVVITPGNAGTLDMLNRGEIAMGPVWVDMFYTWKADGKLPPNMRLKLVSPGMPGQPMYYAIPSKTAQEKLAAEFIALATSPEVQAEGIVKRFNWYPGIDARNLEGKLDQAAWNQLFADIPPDTLATNGKPFPISPYFNDILESYERKVAN